MLLKGVDEMEKEGGWGDEWMNGSDGRGALVKTALPPLPTFF